MANVCESAIVGANQEPASAIPGNIGIVRAKVLVWDHDPFHARAMQQFTYPMTKFTTNELGKDLSDVVFELNGAFLKPIYHLHDTFLGTFHLSAPEKFVNPGTAKEIDINNNIDLLGNLGFINSSDQIVGGSHLGLNAHRRLPGGVEYEEFRHPFGGKKPVRQDSPIGKHIFPHQLWLHIGSLLKFGVPLHPSEYGASLGRIATIKKIKSRRESEDSDSPFTLEDIKSAPKWDYIEHVDADGGNRVYLPQMISKQVPDLHSPVHWTLEKYTSTFQGEDFFVTIKLGEKELDPAVDVVEEDGITDTVGWADYHYTPLMFDPSNTPPNSSTNVRWKAGISNEAYYIKPSEEDDASPPGIFQPDGSIDVEDVEKKLKDPGRKAYWWKYKSYILIEIGAGHPFHNYFIELVKGRNPRFIHLGEEWDHPDRLNDVGIDGILNLEQVRFQYMRKARVLTNGIYKALTCDQLFEQEEIRISVRHHFGQMVITFKGYEAQPWVIAREDNDPQDQSFTKKIHVPIMVPAYRMRIHGGNISCAFGFAPTRYTSEGVIPYQNRQADTFKAENKDVYMTFSHMGNNITYTKIPFNNRFFSDGRFGFIKVGYGCDAYRVTEINKNIFTDMQFNTRGGLYGVYPAQYRLYGKGWIYAQRRRSPSDPSEPGGGFEPDDDLFIKDKTIGLPEPHKLKNGLTSDRNLNINGIPHQLSIINVRNPTTNFPLGLAEQAERTYPYKEYVSKWDVGVQLSAGTVEIPKLTSDRMIDSSSSIKNCRFKNVVTPIVDQWRLIVLPGGKPIEDNVDPFEITDLVTSIEDSWSAEDYTRINHEMHMTCYIPVGVPTGGGPDIGEQDLVELHALGQKLLKLHNKSFYLTVSYWWENGIGERDAIGNLFEREGPPENSDLLIQMTGVSYGAELEKSMNKIMMNFTIKDYMSILEKQFIFNSPFFDGVDDTLAIYELAKMAGFDSNRERNPGIDRRPLGYLQKVIEERDNTPDGKYIYNGEKSLNRRYDLPGSFNTLIQPAVRFQNGETYESAMKKMAALYPKTLYFDRWGVLRFEVTAALTAAFKSKDDRLEFEPVFDFVTTPFQDSNPGTNPDPTPNPNPDPGSQDQGFVFDPTLHASHIVYNVVTYSRSVEDAINQIVLLSASNDLFGDGSNVGGLVVEGYTFFEQIWNPEAEGFFGFRKPFYQSEGAFGDIFGVRQGLAHYARMKYPPAYISFQTYGVPGLKALDIITLDDNLFYITQISHELDPASNNWWMNITGEWFKPFTGDLGFLKERGNQDSGIEG